MFNRKYCLMKRKLDEECFLSGKQKFKKFEISRPGFTGAGRTQSLNHCILFLNPAVWGGCGRQVEQAIFPGSGSLIDTQVSSTNAGHSLPPKTVQCKMCVVCGSLCLALQKQRNI